MRSRLKIAFLLVLASCSLRPQLETPYVYVPETWRVSTDESSAWCNLRWWEQFEDPVLNDYIILALENNRDLKRAAWRVEEFRGLWGVAYADFYPQINGVGQAYQQESSLLGGVIIPGMPRILNFYSAMAQLTYEVDIWGRIQSLSDAALSDYIAQLEVKRTIILTLVSDVAQSYIRLRRLDFQLDIAIRTYESRKEGLHINTLRFEGGLTSELEVKQAESEVQSALASIVTLERQIATEENLLSVLIGQSPGDRERGLALDQLVRPDFVPAGIPSDVLWQRPDLRQKEAVLVGMNARIGAARALFFPKISLTGFYGSQSLAFQTLFTGPSRTWQYGGMMEQPIFNGFRIKNLNEIADSQEKQALYDYEYTIQIAFREVDDALITEVKAKELQDVLTKQVSVNKEYLYLAELQYNNGQTNYLSVLDAQRRLFDSQLLLADAQGATFVALVNLYRSLGGGWVLDAEDISLTEPNCDCESNN